MVPWEHRLSGQRGGDRYRSLFGKGDQLGARAGQGDAAARDDDRSLRPSQRVEGPVDACAVGAGAEWRNTTEGLVGADFHVGFRHRDLGSRAALDIDVDRTGTTGHGGAKGLAEQVGKFRRTRCELARFGDRHEGFHMIDFLIGIPGLIDVNLATGNGQDRRLSEIGVLQSGGEIKRTNRLRHAKSGCSPCPRITVRHVGCGFLAMGSDDFDAQILHIAQRARSDERHIERVRQPVLMHHLGDQFRAGHFGHGYHS